MSVHARAVASLACVASLLVGGGAHAAQLDHELVVLQGPWGYRWGESPTTPTGAAWALDDAAGWNTTDRLPPRAEGEGALWLRIPLPDALFPDATLLASGVRGSCELFAGGAAFARIGAAVDERGRATGLPALGAHLVRLPAETKGGALVARCTSAAGTAGLQPPLVVGSGRALTARLAADMAPEVAIFALLVAIGAGALLLWGVRRQRLTLAIALYGFANGSLVLALAEAPGLFVSDPRVPAILLAFGAGFFVPSIAMLIQESIGGTPAWFRAMVVATAAFGALYALANAAAPDALPALGPVLAAVSLGGLLACAYVAFAAARRGNVEARLFLAGALVLFAFAARDAAPTLSGGNVGGFTVHWGLLALAGAFAVVIARRTFAASAALADRSAALEVEQRDARVRTERLLGTAAQLQAVVAQLGEAGTRQDALVSRQAVSLEQTKITAEELRRTSQLASDRAEKLLARTDRADAAGRDGEAAIGAVLEALSAIGTEVREMAAQVRVAQADAREVGGIVDAVKELADQSNMLALNAAIEAMRAGGDARGFAVVAREMRRLADMSLQATLRIRDVLERFGAGIEMASALSARGEARVGDTLARLRGVGDQLSTLSGAVLETAAGVRQISSTVTQQNEGINQLFAALEELSSQMRETVAQLEQTAGATSTVRGVAEAMREEAAQLPDAVVPRSAA